MIKQRDVAIFNSIPNQNFFRYQVNCVPKTGQMHMYILGKKNAEKVIIWMNQKIGK